MTKSVVAPHASLRRICVFCGSSPGGRPEYAQVARDMGTLLAQESIGLVYGGGNTGLMGEIAGAVLRAGGSVIGVIPEHLKAREIANASVPDLRVVGTMHERKAMMADLADAFIALPGGLGTLEEFFEVVTWSQLGIHEKPTGLLNVRGYYDALLSFLDRCAGEGFVRPQHRALITVATEPAALLRALRSFEPGHTPKWLTPSDA
jgi:uncharacterized protein (TIGR00730 family)